MQENLIKKLHNYLILHHPELLLTLQQEYAVTTYLEDRVAILYDLPGVLLSEGKPVYIVEEICMEALTRDLRPSKFSYLLTLLQEEFETDYRSMAQSGVLTYEVINLLTITKPVLEAFGFSEATEDNSFLRYAIIGTIQEYLQSK